MEKRQPKEIYKGSDRLVIQAEFPMKDPGTLFRYWVEPALVSKWWGPELVKIDARLNGTYEFAWPKQNWVLRGKYTRFQPGKELAFTWHWDHEPTTPETSVRITFEKLGSGGTFLTLTHGDYTPGDKEQRKSHLDGWMYFLPKLRSV